MLNTKIIGQKIAAARKKINISQARLAESLFVSSQAVGKWERGESMPDIITFNRLAEILGVDLNYFSESFQSGEDKTASQKTDDSTNDIEQTVKDDTGLSRSQERQALTNFSGSSLSNSDFAGVTAHKRKFKGSMLRGSDFANADLTGSSFTSSDLCEVNFDGTNLTDCSLSTSAISGASFNKTILVRTEFSKSVLARAKFTDAKLIDVKLNMTDLRETIFKNCIFDGVDFRNSDLRGLCLDGQSLIDVNFDKSALNDVSFSGATLKNVSFRVPVSVTNKSYLAFKTVRFDGTAMDKLTYAALKGLRVVDLSKVTVI